jgi:hypothetical protein
MEGLREAGDSGGIELGAAAASSWAVVALSSVARAELRPAVASLGDGVELRGRGGRARSCRHDLVDDGDIELDVDLKASIQEAIENLSFLSCGAHIRRLHYAGGALVDIV